MHRLRHFIETVLQDQGVAFTPHTPAETKAVTERWLQAFAQGVKQATGTWIYHGFRWHGFNCDYEPALRGESALRAYQRQWSAPYVVFAEEGDWSLACTSERYPDFSALGADLYVAHHNMKWTMAFTHEQPHDGPFFAERGAAPGR